MRHLQNSIRVALVIVFLNDVYQRFQSKQWCFKGRQTIFPIDAALNQHKEKELIIFRDIRAQQICFVGCLKSALNQNLPYSFSECTLLVLLWMIHPCKLFQRTNIVLVIFHENVITCPFSEPAFFTDVMDDIKNHSIVVCTVRSSLQNSYSLWIL